MNYMDVQRNDIHTVQAVYHVYIVNDRYISATWILCK